MDCWQTISRTFATSIFVDVPTHGAAEVLGDELIGTAVFADERCLPGEKIGDAHLLPARPLQLVAGADGAVAGGHVFPAIHVLSPIVQTPGFVQSVGGPKLLLEVIDEAREYIRIRSAVGGGFVIDLPADDGGIVAIVLDHVADEPLRVEAIRGIVRIHVLAHAVKRRAPPSGRARISGWA